MAQNWTSIIEFSWIFSKFCLLIYIYIYITYKLELFLVIQEKKAHKYKIIQKLYFLWFTYIGLFVFYIKLACSPCLRTEILTIVMIRYLS